MNRDLLKSIPAVLLGVLGLWSLGRGIFHYVWFDSGAGVVAGMNLTYPNAADVIFLLGAAGVLQAALGILYMYIALHHRSGLTFVLSLEVIRSIFLVGMQYSFKMPVNPVPGRYAHITVMIVAFVALMIHLYNSRSEKTSYQ